MNNCTSDGFVECKGQCPCGIIAVLGIYICPVLADIKVGGVSVGFVDCVILIAILAGERRGQYIHLGLISSMSDIIIFHSLSALCVELSILKVFIQAN